MDNLTSCPSCNRPLRVPDSLVGQTVKCPGCGENFSAVLHEEAPAPPPRRSAPEPEHFAEKDRRDEDRPVRRRYRDEEDDRPRRYRDEDDDEDDRPRRRRRRYVEHRGTLILVLGVCAWFVAPIPCGPVAWFMGSADLKEMAAGRMDPEGEGQTRAGMILGIVSTILALIGILIACSVIAFIVMVGAAAGGR
jgi:hypothetical protein